MEMTWFQRAALIPSREMTRVYILNAIVAPFLLYLFISSDMPFGVIVATAIFTGAAWHNAAAGIAINRIRESLEAEDAVDPQATNQRSLSPRVCKSCSEIGADPEKER